MLISSLIVLNVRNDFVNGRKDARKILKRIRTSLPLYLCLVLKRVKGGHATPLLCCRIAWPWRSTRPRRRVKRRARTYVGGRVFNRDICIHIYRRWVVVVVVVVARCDIDDDVGGGRREERETGGSRPVVDIYLYVCVRPGRPWPYGLVLVRRRIEHYVPPTLVDSADGTFL